MLSQIIDLFQNGPPQAVIGFVLFMSFCLAAIACLTIGAWQSYYYRPGRVMRRRLRRTLHGRRR